MMSESICDRSDDEGKIINYPFQTYSMGKHKSALNTASRLSINLSFPLSQENTKKVTVIERRFLTITIDHTL